MGGVERNVVILVCAISAGIHAALAPEHFGEGARAGSGFLVSALLLAGLAVALTRGAGLPALVAATHLLLRDHPAGLLTTERTLT